MKSDNLFVNLRGTVPSASAENFVTEALCWLLTVHDTVGRALLEAVLAAADIPLGAGPPLGTWSTQRRLAAPTGGSCPDMVFLAEHLVVVFEHKIEAPVDLSQLALHRVGAMALYAPRRIITVLVACEVEEHRTAVDAALPWRQIQRIMQNAVAHEDEDRFMVEQFIEFLGFEGLGRIPGPCPTYWKANILEARARDSGQGFAGGYRDLGRKFGRTLLASAMHELVNEVPEGKQDYSILLRGLRAALDNPKPQEEMWRFCRRFFPSYVRFTDDRFGTRLQIPDRAGRDFAAGVIEGIEEGEVAMHLED